MGCGASKATTSPSSPTSPVSQPTSPDVKPAVPIKAEPCVAKDAIIIFVLGGPGSGKGTQCDKILAKFSGVRHLSAGDLLREAVKNGNTELEATMKEGKLVPLETTIALLQDAMAKSSETTFLIDGFPRALDQAHAFEKQVGQCSMVLALECSEAEMRERLLERGKTSGRADDNEETIVKRFHTFVEQSKPVIDHYKDCGKVVEVSSSGTPEEVFEAVVAGVVRQLPALAAATAHAEAPTAAPALATPQTLPEDTAPVPPEDTVAAPPEDTVAAPPEDTVTTLPEAQEEAPRALPEGCKIVFVLGGPGSGKGTQCEKILAAYEGVVHLSAGDLLRKAVKSGNTELEAIMKEGKLVPMETTIALLKDAMVASGGATFLIDGFPRALDQAHAFEATVRPCDRVLFFECSEEVMRARLLARGETSGRADDNEETIVKRFRTFVEESRPVVDEFAAAGKVREVSSEAEPEAVFAAVRAALDPLLAV